MLKRIDVTAFVDWQSQFSNAEVNRLALPTRKAEKALEFVTRAIATALSAAGGADVFQVQVRLYHGWHRRLTATDNRRALDGLFADRLAPTRVIKVLFDWSRPFGDTLLDAYPHRLHRRLRNHLPNTMRDDLERPGHDREKMVDTAMACDVLYSARTDPQGWRLVVAEDDDIVPVVFVAEKWAKERGGRTVILRKRAADEYLALAGLLWEI